MYSDLWVEEKFKNFFAKKFKVKKTLYSQKGPFQTVDIVETEGFGRMLLNDGLVMTCDRDEYIYHEMIAHVALNTIPSPKNVLIIGGGDGGTAREVLKHPSIDRVDMVEIDALVVDSCKEFLPHIFAEQNNPKLNVIIEDGVDFVKKASRSFYDVVLVDSTDPIGPAAPLFNASFYNDVFSILKDDGIVASQCEPVFFELETQKSLLKILKEIFPFLGIYNYTNLTYPGGLWSFSFASKKYAPLGLSPDFLREKISLLETKQKFKYYNQSLHFGSFCLPSFQQDALKNLLNLNNLW